MTLDRGLDWSLRIGFWLFSATTIIGWGAGWI